MNKIKIILLAAVLLGGTPAFAQQNWNVGVGYAMNSFKGTDCSLFLTKHPVHGFYAGVRHEFYFSALAGLTFEPGFFFYYQSGRNDADLKPKYIKMHYLSIPMDIKYTFNITEAAMASFFTGPVVNVGLIGNLYEKNQFETTRDAADPMHPLTRVNLQWCFGAAVTIAEAVQIRISYGLGISRLIPEQEIHNNTLTIGAGLLF